MLVPVGVSARWGSSSCQAVEITVGSDAAAFRLNLIQSETELPGGGPSSGAKCLLFFILAPKYETSAVEQLKQKLKVPEKKMLMAHG